jgi:hypothetical protein
MAMATRALQAAGKQGAAQHKAQLQAQAARELERRTHKPRIATITEIQPVNLEEQKQLPELNAAKMLDHIENVLNYWARFENPNYSTIVTLWIASTWLVDTEGRLLFDAHPRLFPIAYPGSGKTRLMKLVRAMARKPTGIVKAPVTAPGLRDALDATYTVLLDELDRQTGRGTAHMDVQSIISAYEADTGSLNGIGGMNEHNLFGPMMLAAKPKILTATGGFLDDLFERSFILTMVKYTKQSDPIPDLDNKFDEIVKPLGRVLQLWGEAIRPEEGKFRPIHTMPPKLTSRMREISAPLLAVADRAVDPDVMRATGMDVRWALKGRAAVQNVLLGHADNGAELIAELDERFKELGIS